MTARAACPLLPRTARARIPEQWLRHAAIPAEADRMESLAHETSPAHAGPRLSFPAWKPGDAADLATAVHDCHLASRSHHCSEVAPHARRAPGSYPLPASTVDVTPFPRPCFHWPGAPYRFAGLPMVRDSRPSCQRQRPSGASAADAALDLEHDRDRPVVDEVDRHPRPEDAG